MKRIISIVIAMALLACLSGCRDGGKNTANDKIAFVTDMGQIDDDSFNESIWETVKSCADKNKADSVFYIPEMDSDESRKAAADQAVADGADLVFLSGNYWGEILPDLQTENPNVKFAALDVTMSDMAGKPANNTYICSYHEEVAGYLAGYAAVMEGYDRLGFLGGIDVPAVQRYGYGYIQGADAAAAMLKHQIRIKYSYTGKFYGDSEVAKQAANWYMSGTQVIFSCGGSMYTSVVEAALKYNQHIIGVDTDQHEVGERYEYNPFLTSATKGLAQSVEMIMDRYFKNEWSVIGGQSDNLGLDEGDYVGIPTVEDSWEFKNFTREQYDEVIARLKDKSIKVSPDVDEMPDTSEYTSVKKL